MSAIVLFCLLAPAGADQPKLHAPTVTIQERDLTLSKALAELRDQTGLTVALDRGVKDIPLALALDRVSFWQAIDTVARQAKAKAILARDGTVTLVPLHAKDHAVPTHYDGPFRVRVVRTNAIKELESDDGRCVLTMELVWTPTLRPLFIDSLAQGVKLGDMSIPAEGASLTPVDDRRSFPFEVTLPYQPRERKSLPLLEGKIQAVVPNKFLTFPFDADLATMKDAVIDGAVRRLVQDDVVCRIARVVLDKERWSVEVALDYPAGGKVLESFQAASLVVHNELVMESKDGKRKLTPSNYVVESVSSRRARVTYHFTDRAGARLGTPANWKLRYRAAARILDVPVRFRFADVPLP
jgi:hypothetical protein